MARLSREDAAIIGAFTGVLMGPFEDIHKLAEESEGRPVYTHEMGTGPVTDRLKDHVRKRFMALCAEREA